MHAGRHFNGENAKKGAAGDLLWEKVASQQNYLEMF